LGDIIGGHTMFQAVTCRFLITEVTIQSPGSPREISVAQSGTGAVVWVLRISLPVIIPPIRHALSLSGGAGRRPKWSRSTKGLSLWCHWPLSGLMGSSGLL